MSDYARYHKGALEGEHGGSGVRVDSAVVAVGLVSRGRRVPVVLCAGVRRPMSMMVVVRGLRLSAYVVVIGEGVCGHWA